MKLVLSALLSLSLFCLTSAQAGIPTTVCSTADGGVRLKSDFPGMQHLEIVTDREGAFERLESTDYRIVEDEVQVISSSTTDSGMGARPYAERVYSAKLTISKSDGSALPGAYTASRAADGSITVFAICKFSAY